MNGKGIFQMGQQPVEGIFTNRNPTGFQVGEKCIDTECPGGFAKQLLKKLR